MRTRVSAAVALLALSLAGGAALAQAPGGPPGAGPGGPPGGGRGGGGMGGMVISTTMLVESNAFPDGGIIPAKYSMQGGVQPDFKITGIPATATSVVLIFHDNEIVGAGGPADDNLHWMAWNIPVVNGTAVLEEGKLPDGATGKGGRGAAYMGPGAPAGVRYHHYIFDFYAINGKIDLPANGLRPEMFEAMKGKVVGKASYIGRFKGEQGAGGGARGGGGFGGGAGGPPRGPGGPGGPGGPPPGAAPGGF